jgi:hypothetical protein
MKQNISKPSDVTEKGWGAVDGRKRQEGSTRKDWNFLCMRYRLAVLTIPRLADQLAFLFVKFIEAWTILLHV